MEADGATPRPTLPSTHLCLPCVSQACVPLRRLVLTCPPCGSLPALWSRPRGGAGGRRQVGGPAVHLVPREARLHAHSRRGELGAPAAEERGCAVSVRHVPCAGPCTAEGAADIRYEAHVYRSTLCLQVQRHVCRRCPKRHKRKAKAQSPIAAVSYSSDRRPNRMPVTVFASLCGFFLFRDRHTHVLSRSPHTTL